MTNDELKKKILSIVRGAMLEADELPFLETTDNIADALIAAGIGDVKDLQAQVDVLEITNIALQAGYDGAEEDRLYWVNKYKEAEHRAARAEKELLVYKEVAGTMLCEIGCSNEGYCPEFYKDPECKNCTKKKIYGNFAATSPCLLDKYIQQAEKELAEEKKDD